MTISSSFKVTSQFLCMATTPNDSKQPVCVPDSVTGDKIVHWKIHRRQLVNPSVSVCELIDETSGKIEIKAPGHGWVTKMKDDGATVFARCLLFNFLPCTHHVVMKDLCAECGANLRREGGISGERIANASASIPMVHAIPELHVSETVADEIALQDQQSLLSARKLVLLVDLDQTIIHTTNDPQAFKYKNVHRYRLPGSPLVYHTRLRPHLEKVLDCLSQYYQMHICTFGNRVYAHQLASMIDPKRRYFSQRILSRDECFNPVTKSANLKLEPVRCISNKTNDNETAAVEVLEDYNLNQSKNDNDVEYCQTQSSTIGMTVSLSKNSVDCIDDIATADNEIQLTSNEDLSDNDNSSSSKLKEIEAEMDAIDEDYLLRLQEILLRIHRNYFKTYDLWQIHNQTTMMTKSQDKKQNYNSSNSSTINNNSCKNVSTTNSTGNSDVMSTYLPHVSDIITKLRKTVLGPNCHITLSGLSPAHFPADRCLAGRIVRSLGGVLHAGLRLPSISNQSNDKIINSHNDDDHEIPLPVNESEPKTASHSVVHTTQYTTHLIACRRGTEKVHAALKYLATNDNIQLNDNSSSHSLHLVSPHWLWSCHYHWDHVCESKYPLNRDFHPSDFDPDIEAVPGTIRYARRMRRHYYHHHHPHHSTHNDNHSHHHRHHRHSQHSHSHHHHHLQEKHTHKHSHKHHRSTKELLPSADANDEIKQKIPRLDPSIVRSALNSIRTERENDRKRKLKRKSKSIKHKRHRKNVPPHEDAKEKNISLIDNLTINDDHSGEISENDSSSSSSSSPSLKSDSSSVESNHQDKQMHKSSSLTEEHFIDNKNSVISTENSKLACLFNESLCDHNPVTENNVTNCSLCNTDSFLYHSDNPSYQSVTEIKDEGDQDFDEYTTIENFIECDDENDYDDEIEVDRSREEHFSTDDIGDNKEEEHSDLINKQTESEEDEEENVKAQLSEFLPPPTTLVLADNPLMHLPPDATGKMLAEIEDAVLEEVTERASSVPREAEIYDPAVDSFNDSSSDSLSDNQTSVELTKLHDSHILTRNKTTTELPKNPMEYDRRTLHWQVQRELLVRRRHRASPTETAKIDRKIRRLDQHFRRESRRRRSCDDLMFRISATNHYCQ
ncbi:RNA polymerase II subunit A C-terminal domain phosphatase [Schistosoma japonicum]|uniref:protein-serine/threonine phosphatase n=1 Tax=Schistosoma japonicum TaxID=6182 RepID=A0A4Z2D8F2_SCHJA|nr:RNA polymerase II subunit A C-terminal domain phosphatase [Schistosoma japonicum]